MEKCYDVVIVGAGISGLSARNHLIESNYSTCVLEKSRGTGGRIAVRRGEGWVADFGAQFTNAQNELWKAVLQNEGENLAEVEVEENAQVLRRYIHKLGMNSFAKALTKNADDFNPIFFGLKVTRISRSHNRNFNWSVETECGKKIESRSLIITAPLPQSLELLQNSPLLIKKTDLEYLKQIEYDKCLCVITEIEGFVSNSVAAVWKNPNPALAGIYNQQKKGIISSKPVWVVHASPTFSSIYWNESQENIISNMLFETSAAFKFSENKFSENKFSFKNTALHKWLYSSPIRALKEEAFELQLEEENPKRAAIILAGDSFRRSSVEGAFCSGLAAAKMVCEKI